MPTPWRLRLLCGCALIAVVTCINDADPFVGVSHEVRKGSGSVTSDVKFVTIHVPQGTIRIRLLPELSRSSVDYVVNVAQQNKCASSRECKFYRAEPTFLLQGNMKTQLPPNRQLGPCPAEFAGKPRATACPAHDPNCGCHGPIMVPGQVGWAGGGSGPDFFIYTGQGPATHWNNDHTVWGELADQESLSVVEAVLQLPTDRPPHGMLMLKHTIPFTIQLE
ncbi:hypothetical protein CYMTET_24073 [Cymbomonas tetramitiformis]|uniref:PPIase cyclophilin-type domain-containing protein n=1 Tax=Cymbomonas tetramitiformis TaxID=36881 RepID=A0AAE0L096_9CHLO|nr:hypothetical protein CYMTET_24073 [Cymbomonas tetramitiformis]